MWQPADLERPLLPNKGNFFFLKWWDRRPMILLFPNSKFDESEAAAAPPMIPLALLLHWTTDDEFRDEMMLGEILCGRDNYT
jgi:hypothetical protein